MDRRRGLGARLLPAREPRLKRTAYAWLTDFVGWLPMPETTVAEPRPRSPRTTTPTCWSSSRGCRGVRDRSLFVGNRDDVLDASFGPGCRGSGTGSARSYEFTGYITGFDPDRSPTAAHCAPEFGVRLTASPLCVVAVGGSGVGGPSAPPGRSRLTTVAAARVPGLRHVVVAGPASTPRPCPRAVVWTFAASSRRCTEDVGGLRLRHRPRRAHDDDGADRRQAGRSSTSRCGTTSSRTCMSGTGSPTMAPAPA